MVHAQIFVGINSILTKILYANGVRMVAKSVLIAPFAMHVQQTLSWIESIDYATVLLINSLIQRRVSQNVLKLSLEKMGNAWAAAGNA